MPCQERTSPLPTLTYSMTFKILESPKCYWLNVNVGTWEGGSQPWAMNSQRNIMGSWINESSITCWKKCNQSNAGINMFKKAAAKESHDGELLARFIIHNMSVQEWTKITTLWHQVNIKWMKNNREKQPILVQQNITPGFVPSHTHTVSHREILSVSQPLCLHLV